jgi:hypothetical protein
MGERNVKGLLDLASTLRSFLRNPHPAGLIEELRSYERFRRSPIRGTGRAARGRNRRRSRSY